MRAGLSAVNYVAFAFPRLSPFVPLYKGLLDAGAGALPASLTAAASEPDSSSLFWKARRLQVGWGRAGSRRLPVLRAPACYGMARQESCICSLHLR